MTLPQLPTDSLYKLIFISGVALIVYGQYLSFQSIDELEKEVTNATLAWVRDSAQLRVVEVPRLNTNDSADSARLQLLLDKQHVEYLVISRKLELIHHLSDAKDRSIGYINKMGWLNLLTGIIGWYYYVQRYQDKILKRQALDAEPDEPLKGEWKLKLFIALLWIGLFIYTLVS